MPKAAKAKKKTAKGKGQTRFIFSVDSELLEQIKQRAASLNLSTAQHLVGLALRDLILGGPVTTVELRPYKADADMVRAFAAKTGLSESQALGLALDAGKEQLRRDREKEEKNIERDLELPVEVWEELKKQMPPKYKRDYSAYIVELIKLDLATQALRALDRQSGKPADSK